MEVLFLPAPFLGIVEEIPPNEIVSYIDLLSEECDYSCISLFSLTPPHTGCGLDKYGHIEIRNFHPWSLGVTVTSPIH